MTDEIKEILDKLSNRKQETLVQGLRECQLKNIEHPFITKEEYIDKILDYITNLQQENEKLKEDNLLIKSANKLVSDNLHNYKSRCLKAIEILKLCNSKCAKETINILQGSDENDS